MQMIATGGGVPPEQFLQALETHSNLGAVVLFMGFPQLTDSELEVLKKSGVKIVVACALRPGDQRLLERQVIHLAIVPRSDSPPPGLRRLGPCASASTRNSRSSPCDGCRVALKPVAAGKPERIRSPGCRPMRWPFLRTGFRNG